MRTVCHTPHHWHALKELQFYSEPVEDPPPFGPPPLIYRIEKTEDGFTVAGYTLGELRELSRG